MTNELKPLLMVLTSSYPFAVATERTFIEPELLRYRDQFAQIVVVPQDTRGEQAPVPAGIEVDTSMAEGLRRMWGIPLLVRGLLSWRLYRELLNYPRLLGAPLVVLRMAITCGAVEWMARWFERSRPETASQPPTTIYAFWLDASILAAGVYRQRGGRAGVVARAHGWDLYAERRSPAHLPFQLETIALIDHVAPDSVAGTLYLQRKYPEHAHKIRCALLGVDDPGIRVAASSDGVLRLVSCSFLVEVKRVHLIVAGIAALADRYKGRCIEWTHFGGGPLLASIRALAESSLHGHVQWRLRGTVEMSVIYDWYREHPVDVFINVSSFEGTPVSIMEAISCSIPVIATSIGGNEEIVNESLGQLISADPTADEIALAIERVCFDRPRLEALKRGSHEQWSKNYSAEKNYRAFGCVLRGGG